MSDFARVEITDKFGDTISVEISSAGVFVEIAENDDKTGVALSTDQCAALIAAITDAARLVTGEKA
tara:strand:+ start:1525 stop:1722 length:198 start_codon:yes stop_codon:yes gene_type:complete